ncbi:hypothetical protein O3P69_012175 [Scylla paramamosain]|uniref:Uncharacterized protein n=1 Tax=Scylla paramamosain TaxID=85552 RepID=A0AAW0TF57_SCYPA
MIHIGGVTVTSEEHHTDQFLSAIIVSRSRLTYNSCPEDHSPSSSHTWLKPSGKLEALQKRWLNYSILSNLTHKSHAYQIALLENNLGNDAMRIYEGFHFDTPYEERTTAEIFAKLKVYAVGEEDKT